MQQISLRKDWVEAWDAVYTRSGDFGALIELAEEAEDESLKGELDSELAAQTDAILRVSFVLDFLWEDGSAFTT